jgi:hypothetical protein
MAEENDAVNESRLYGVLECSVEAISDWAWKLQLSQLEPWLQTELAEVTHSDGLQTYMPRVVWLLVAGFAGASNTRKLN